MVNHVWGHYNRWQRNEYDYRYPIGKFWFHHNMCGTAQFGTDSVFPYWHYHRHKVSAGHPSHRILIILLFRLDL
jgi:hypothetical protein